MPKGGGGGGGRESESPRERAPPFFTGPVCVDRSQAQAQAANRRRPHPAAAEQDTLETQLPTPNGGNWPVGRHTVHTGLQNKPAGRHHKKLKGSALTILAHRCGSTALWCTNFSGYVTSEMLCPDRDSAYGSTKNISAPPPSSFEGKADRAIGGRRPELCARRMRMARRGVSVE